MNMDVVREVLKTAQVFELSLEDLKRATSYAESVEEWQRVVDEMAVALNG